MNIHIYKKSGLFFGLSTLIPWVLWFIAGYISHIETRSKAPQLWSSIVAFLGLLAPVIITLFLAKGNKQMVHDLKKRFFNFKGINSVYIILTIILMPFSILIAQAVSLLFGYSIEQFQLANSFSFTSGVFPVWFMLIIAPLLEELAWHSYGTDSLRSRHNLLKTSILFALFWGIWHLPLASINNYYHSNLVEEGWIYSLNFIVSLFPFVIIMNWIYYKANRNIILPILFHIAAGFFNEIFATHPMSKVIQTCLLIVFALYIILNDKAFFFNQTNNIS
ncbi:CPBP family intramembrane glutamic endopeptidase [uncultured Algibacter sp.]|uniref:CPBP family intramembrane glutamic endopeptidase n=1 Tax=uncultured Algibacter sp. TaxID=298659 RepID=UPI00260FED41|nr:CPBP family intramembrane glutamic endopeptidase [uncultured Algibacter sp.]